MSKTYAICDANPASPGWILIKMLESGPLIGPFVKQSTVSGRLQLADSSLATSAVPYSKIAMTTLLGVHDAFSSSPQVPFGIFPPTEMPGPRSATHAKCRSRNLECMILMVAIRLSLSKVSSMGCGQVPDQTALSSPPPVLLIAVFPVAGLRTTMHSCTL